MIDLLDNALGRLLNGLGAQAAVIWSSRSEPAGGVVVATYPTDLLPTDALLPTGAHWPLIDGSTGCERDPDRLAALVPAIVRRALTGVPTAARTFKLGEGNLSVFVVWCTESPAEELSSGRQTLIDEELGYLARVVEDSRVNRGEVARLRAVVNRLDEGIVSVDSILDHATVSESAAKLLRLSPGRVAASVFSRALARLASDALKHDEITHTDVQAEPTGQCEQVWRFAEQPTHLRVTSMAVRNDGFDGTVWLFTDESTVSQAVSNAENALDLVRTTADAMLDPLARLSAVRDSSGQIVDFVYLAVNRAACESLSRTREQLVGESLVAAVPDVKTTGLLAHLVHCCRAGEALVLDDFDLFNDFISKHSRYDIQVTRSGDDSITLTWRDVSDRFAAAERMAESEEQFRLLAESSGDMVARIRDGRFFWVSPAAEQVLGAPPEYWQGRRVREVVPPGLEADHLDHVTRLLAGESVQTRAQLVSFGGELRWVHLNAKPYCGLDGNQDGIVVSLRLVDSEVAAEREAERARASQARTDARYRRLLESSSVGMCINSPAGRFEMVNEALCKFLGYDADTLCTMTWLDLIPADDVITDVQDIDDMLAGRIETYRQTKRYLHADGHTMWGDLSVSCIRDAGGQVERFIAQIIDVTAEVEARQQLAERDENNRLLTRNLQAKTDRLTFELNTAAAYVES
ncbi:MAG: PAS domain S-box protein, partial [Mycobacteriaceae bacterium]